MSYFPISLDDKRKDKTALITCIAIVFVSVILALVLFFNTFYTRIYVVGPSMQNTLTGAPSVKEAGGDYVYISKFITPQRGDIVVIDAGNISLIKRAIAFGGDSLKMENGQLYLKRSGEKSFSLVKEPYVLPENNVNTKLNTFDEVTVKRGYVFFMGDNRDNSDDSRGAYYGMMPVENISGVVADWSMQYKSAITSINTFFEFTLPRFLRAI